MVMFKGVIQDIYFSHTLRATKQMLLNNMSLQKPSQRGVFSGISIRMECIQTQRKYLFFLIQQQDGSFFANKSLYSDSILFQAKVSGHYSPAHTKNFVTESPKIFLNACQAFFNVIDFSNKILLYFKHFSNCSYS